MESSQLLTVLISLSCILLAFERVSAENVHSNEQDLIETTATSHDILRRGLNFIDNAISNVFPSEQDRAYASLHALVDNYKHQHGHHQLMREIQQCRERNSNTGSFGCPELDDRKFLVAYYSCPEQAGNRLHHFVNGMIWAVVTNRTLLYDVYDAEICGAIWMYRRGRVGGRCKALGTRYERVEDCNRALQLAEWMPSFHEWKDELGLEEPTLAHCGPGGKTDEYRIKGLDMLPDRVMSSCFGSMKNAGMALSSFLTSPSDIALKGLLVKESSIKIAHTLLSADGISWEGLFDGGWYLYGMLLNEAFQIRNFLLPDSAEISSGPDVVSIAIHSRHIDILDDGRDITEEKVCLKYLLKRIRTQKAADKCAVYIMSDRIATAEGLVRESELLGCRAIKLNQRTDKVQLSFSKEHGPFDTIDFIRDLALVRNAEDGLISSSRSTATSTWLLREMMEYNRKNNGIRGEIETCTLARDT